MLSIPTPDKIERILSGLLNRPVRATPAATPPVASVPFFGLFGSGSGAPGAASFADLSLAAYAGAALVMIPPDVAQQCVRTGRLDELLGENFAEVYNVCSRLFSDDDAVRVRLMSNVFPPSPLPQAAPKILAIAAPRPRLDVELAVEGYGKGRLSLRVF